MTISPTAPPLSLRRFFGRLRDPRRHHLKRHLLLDIVGITLCAVIAGANDWQQIVTFARHRRDWLATFLALPNNIPSHDTLERVFDRLDPSAFLACFQRWVEALAGSLGLGHIAIDGKTLRGSGNGPKGWKCLHLVSAWASQCHLSLGQVAIDDKSNEITAIPRLLELLDLQGALVTIDAMGCQKEIAREIIDGGGDYLLTVKENQPRLLEDIQNKIADVLDGKSGAGKYQQWESVDQGHGRREKRSYLTITDLEGIRDRQLWKGLKVIGMCVNECERNGKRGEDVRYFIGSREMSAQAYGEALRYHWGIENNLHWQLDITLREDSNRVQRRHGTENLALVRRLAVSLLKRHPSQDSLACKRLAAAVNPVFLEEILAAGCKPEKP